MGLDSINNFLNGVYKLSASNEGFPENALYTFPHPRFMEIPAIFASCPGQGMTASESWFRGVRPVVCGRTTPFDEAASEVPRYDDRTPVVVVDSDSLSARRFTEGVVKRMKVRGCDIWLMTWIEDADDLFDAFNTNADMVLGPYHATGSDEDLSDILSVSDSFVPAVFVAGGRAVMRRAGRDSVPDALSRLADLGFYRTCVVDTDDSLSGSWETLRDDFPSAIPFTRSPESTEAIAGPRIGCLWAPRFPR